MGHEAAVEAYLRVISVSVKTTTHQIPIRLRVKKIFSNKKVSPAKNCLPPYINLYSPRARLTFGQNSKFINKMPAGLE